VFGSPSTTIHSKKKSTGADFFLSHVPKLSAEAVTASIIQFIGDYNKIGSHLTELRDVDGLALVALDFCVAMLALGGRGTNSRQE